MLKPSEVGLDPEEWSDLEKYGVIRVDAEELAQLITALLAVPERKVTVELPARSVQF